MKRRPLLTVAILLAVAACATTPISGRKAFIPFPVSEDVTLGIAAYDQSVGGLPLVTSGAQFQMVQNAMNRLVAGLGADDPGFDWEVRLIRDDAMVNAFCLPGGKMAVYTGILPVAQTEDGLAVVMGHEIAHAIARHGMQRLTVEYGVQGALDLAEAFLSPDLASVRDLTEGATDLLISKPYGRDNELESDYIGLILMARAGYDPRNATKFWERMASLGSSGTPEFLSTHPSHGRRIEELEAAMPEALAIYQNR